VATRRQLGQASSAANRLVANRVLEDGGARTRLSTVIRGRQRGEDLVHARGRSTHSLNFLHRKGHVDLEPCPYHGLFSLWRSSESTRDLPADGLRHTAFPVQRGQKDERLGALLELAAKTPVFWVSVAWVRHEAGR